MMRGVAALCAREGIACQVSMERMMGCGFGACSCCNVPLVAGGYALCCQDGPVFDATEVAW
jgi:dihydroorotate dehydrogenase electron transfer subunit